MKRFILRDKSPKIPEGTHMSDASMHTPRKRGTAERLRTKVAPWAERRDPEATCLGYVLLTACQYVTKPICLTFSNPE